MKSKKTARARREKAVTPPKVHQNYDFNTSRYITGQEYDCWAVPIHMKYVAAAGLANAPVLG